MKHPATALKTSLAGPLSGQRVGRFVLGERLGKGGMGEVYRADDTRLKRPVALKRLSPDLRSDPLYRRRFQEEAERASRFSDAHVAAIYDVFEEQGEIFLVMELVDGQTLRQRLWEPMTLEQFLGIAVQCAEALVAAHDRGIVHCDIKPENIMLTNSGQVKILDFGVAKYLPRSDQSSTIDRAGTVGGTPAYMAPEVLLEKTPDGRADIFSLGIVFYEALTGHHPFRSRGYVATTHRVLHEEPAPIRRFNPKVPAELETIVGHMLAKDSTNRYTNASDLLDDLQLVRQGVTPSKLLPRPLIAERARRRRWLWVAAAVTIVAIVGYGIYRRTRPPVFKERGWVLISDFDSSGEDPINDKGVREGLTIALQQSPYVNVYPRTRVYEAVQRMKRSEVTRIDEALGREICRRENLQVLLAGSIEHVGQAYQITVRGENPLNGNLILAEKQTFDRKEQFFDRADRLARAVRKDLGESVTKIDKTSRALAKVTTSSLDALQLYSQASDLLAQGKLEQAQPLLQSALQIDPNFAMAHRLIADVYETVGNREEESRHLTRAYELRNGLTDREQRLIEASYYNVHGEYEEALHSLSILVTLNPDDANAHRELASAYRTVGDLQHAIEQLREVLRLTPEDTRAYSVLVQYLAWNNANEEAIKVYKEATDRGFEAPGLTWGLGLALWGEGRLEEARQQFKHLQDAGGAYESIGRLYVARTLIYEGRYSAAEDQLRNELQLDKTSANKSPELLARYLLAKILAEKGQNSQAVAELQTILKGGEPEALQAEDLRRAGTLYARLGDLNSATLALRHLETLRSSLPSGFNRSSQHNVAAEIAMTNGKPMLAAELFSLALSEYRSLSSHEGLARSYEAQRNWSRASEEWKQVLASRGEIMRDAFPADWVLAHLELARVLNRLNNRDSAVAEYKTFLTLWQNADPLPVRGKASQELRHLTQVMSTQARAVGTSH